MHPPVTLAILVYNQARYIADCFNAAVSQTYDNLQIIISDDRSTDDSFDRIKELVGAYNGPHKILVNRNERNLGTLAHFYEIAKLATGEYLVVNAGDDWSRPDRIQQIADRFAATEASVLISDYVLVTDDGQVMDDHYVPEFLFPKYFKGVDFMPIHGASAAYDMKLLSALCPPGQRTLYEDTFFTLGTLLEGGRIERIAEPLVYYRQSTMSVSNNPDVEIHLPAVIEREKKYSLNAHYFLVVLEWFREEVIRRGLNSQVDLNELDADIAHYRHRSIWLDVSFATRLRAVLESRQRSYLHWGLPRLFGVSGLTRFKAARRGVRIFTGHRLGVSRV